MPLPTTALVNSGPIPIRHVYSDCGRAHTLSENVRDLACWCWPVIIDDTETDGLMVLHNSIH